MLKNAIRDGGSTSLYASYTVDIVHTVDIVYTVDTVYTVDMGFTVGTGDTVESVDTSSSSSILLEWHGRNCYIVVSFTNSGAQMTPRAIVGL